MSLTGVLNSHLMVAELFTVSAPTISAASSSPPSPPASCAAASPSPNRRRHRSAGIRTPRRRDGDHYVVAEPRCGSPTPGKGNACRCSSRPTRLPSPATAACDLARREGCHGYTVTRELGKLGYKGLDTCEVVFDDVWVPEDRLLGGIEGRGSLQPQGGLEWAHQHRRPRRGRRQGRDRGRVALQPTAPHHGQPIVEHQAIQLKLADMACRVAAARLLPTGPPRLDSGRRCDIEAGMAKLVAPRLRSRTPPRPCGSTAPTATRPRSTSSATTATPRCCASARAPTRSSASPSPSARLPGRRPDVTVARRPSGHGAASSRLDGRFRSASRPSGTAPFHLLDF